MDKVPLNSHGKHVLFLNLWDTVATFNQCKLKTTEKIENDKGEVELQRKEYV